LPRELTDRLASEVGKALADGDLRNTLLAQGVDPRASSPEETEAFIRTEVRKWDKIVKETGASSN
jgi:tripartite-type tricarboxylate transporter receptor subunit TctC